MLTVKSITVSHTGHVREHNEDALYADDHQGIWLVADGMGGHASGEVASQLAVKSIIEAINEGQPLTEAIKQSHLAILNQAEQKPEQKGMGTTIVAAQQLKTSFKIAWVGDSRAYLINNQLQQITTDHSFVQDMVFREILTSEEAEKHPQKNLINRSLGMEGRPCKVDYKTIYPTASGALLLVTDGVSDFLSHEQIQSLFKPAQSQAETSQQLTQAILKTEAADNFSFVIIDFKLGWREKWQNKFKW